MEEIRSYTVELIDEIKTEEGTFRHDNLTNEEVPELRKTAACGEWKERKTARLPGQRVQLPRDGFPHDEMRDARSAISAWR